MNRALGGAFAALHNFILDPGSDGESDSTLLGPGSGLDGMAYSRPGNSNEAGHCDYESGSAGEDRCNGDRCGNFDGHAAGSAASSTKA